MDFTFSLACSYMMMECPRCGFAQPKDRYCASCGLDLEHFVAKPKPFWARLAQNPNLHLSLIGVLILTVVAYIFYAQRELVSREMGALLNGTPLASRDSAEPKNSGGKAPEPEVVPAAEEPKNPEPVNSPEAAAAAAPLPTAVADATSPTVDKPGEPTKVEVSYWEISREALSGLITNAEKVGESNEGRAYLWTQGSKTLESVQSVGRRLGVNRTMLLQTGSQLSIETPSASSEAFQYGLYFQLTKTEGKEISLKFESTMVLPPAETAAEAAAQNPAVKALTEVALNGSASLGAQSALLIVFEPTNRTLREDYLNKAGVGPWSIFTSEEFRGGISEWVALIQLK